MSNHSLSYNSSSLFFTETLLFSFLSTRLTINSLLVAKSDKMAKNKAFYYLFIYYLLNKDDANLRRWHLATYLPFSLTSSVFVHCSFVSF